MRIDDDQNSPASEASPPNPQAEPAAIAESTFATDEIPDFDSLIQGLSGPAAQALLGGAWLIAMFWLIENFATRVLPAPFVVVGLFLVMLIPPLVPSAFLISTVMMWYGRLFMRFILGVVFLLPAIFAFVVLAAFGNGADSSFLLGVGLCMFSLLLGAACVAVAVQLLSCWTLVHSSQVRTLPQTGLGMIIELTVLSAIATAIFTAVSGLGEYLPAIAFTAGVGALVAGMVIVLHIYFLGDKQAGPWGWGIMTTLAISIVVFMTGVAKNLTDLPFPRTSFVELIFLTVVGLPNVGLIAFLCWRQLRWLRRCGWRCVDRRALGALRTQQQLEPAGPFAE